MVWFFDKGTETAILLKNGLRKSRLLQKFSTTSIAKCLCIQIQKQPSTGVLIKSCSENMQKIYRRTPMPKCNFNKVALHFGMDVLL